MYQHFTIFYQKMKGFSLNYLVRPAIIEQENGKSPAIFMLHGYGQNKEEFFSIANELPQEYIVSSLQAPYKLSDIEFFWYAIEFGASKWCDIVQAQAAQQKLLTFLGQACDRFNIDTEQITLIGFDQGGILSLSLALSYPEKIQRVVAINSYIDKKLLSFNYQKNNFKKLKICLLHGYSNEIVSLDWAEETIELFKKLHIDYSYQTFASGHVFSAEMFYAMKNWIEQQK